MACDVVVMSNTIAVTIAVTIVSIRSTTTVRVSASPSFGAGIAIKGRA